MAKDEVWNELFEFSPTERNQIIHDAPGCVVCWTRRDGGPGAAFLTHVVMDGVIYFTSEDVRGKNTAYRRDPRAAIVFECPKGAITVLGRVEFDDDPQVRKRFLETHRDKVVALARSGRLVLPGLTPENFIRMEDQPRRRILRVVPEKYSSVNISKLDWSAQDNS
jgi:hypothetical protein